MCLQEPPQNGVVPAIKINHYAARRKASEKCECTQTVVLDACVGTVDGIHRAEHYQGKEGW